VRRAQFHTAADVARFATRNMRADNPGTLPQADYWAILAFALHANGVDLPAPLDASNAANVTLHK